MSGERIYTERDLVLAKREAYCVGRHVSLTAVPMAPADRTYYWHDAELRYPLPKIVRPRVVRDESVDWLREFRVVDGCFEARKHTGLGSEWTRDGFDGWHLSPAVIRLFADLLAHPTEEVPDEADVPPIPQHGGPEG
jgi:hypothetical protein